MASIHFSTFAPHKTTFFCKSSHISPFISPKLSFLAASNVQTLYQRPKRARKHLTASSLSDDTDTAVGSAVKVADNETSLELKKKAMDVAPGLKGTCIFLVGMKSSIKTQLAKALAEVLGYYYFDSDALIEEAAGGEASAKLLKETDEQGFRNSETEVLKQLSSMGRLVVCAGDGAVQSSTNLALLRYGICIWVDVPLDIISDEEHSEDFTVQFEELRGGYATADVTVSLQKMAAFRGYDDFTAVTAEETALEVLKELEKLTRVKKMMEEAGRPF